MTREDCKAGLERLAVAWGVNLAKPTTDAIFGRIQHITAEAWQSAVDELLVNYLRAPSAGLLDHVLKAVESVTDHRRKVTLMKDRQGAKGILHPGYRITHDDPQEREYGTFRLNLVRRGVNESKRPYVQTLSDGTEVRLTDRIAMAKIHVDGLSAWLGEPKYAAWARDTKVNVDGDCGFHKGVHSLLACLTDELRYWTFRAAGKTEPEAKRLITV